MYKIGFAGTGLCNSLDYVCEAGLWKSRQCWEWGLEAGLNKPSRYLRNVSLAPWKANEALGAGSLPTPERHRPCVGLFPPCSASFYACLQTIVSAEVLMGRRELCLVVSSLMVILIKLAWF